jgi:hypothetical protein
MAANTRAKLDHLSSVEETQISLDQLDFINTNPQSVRFQVFLQSYTVKCLECNTSFMAVDILPH